MSCHSCGVNSGLGAEFFAQQLPSAASAPACKKNFSGCMYSTQGDLVCTPVVEKFTGDTGPHDTSFANNISSSLKSMMDKAKLSYPQHSTHPEKQHK